MTVLEYLPIDRLIGFDRIECRVVTERIVARVSRPEYVPLRDDRPRIDASESRVAELERELVYWRNRAIAEWAKSAERVRIAEARMGDARKVVTVREAHIRTLQAEVTRLKQDVTRSKKEVSRSKREVIRLKAEVTRLKKRVAAFERRFGSRLRHKVGAILRRFGLL